MSLLLFSLTLCTLSQADYLVRTVTVNSVNYDDFSLLCSEGIPLLLEDHSPRPCQPRPWKPDQKCPSGFWCHEGEGETSFYCCPRSRKYFNHCHLPPATGYGKQLMRRFYYDWKTDGCHELQYTGVGGNQNSYMTYNECEAACRGAGEPPDAWQTGNETSSTKEKESIKEILKEKGQKGTPKKGKGDIPSTTSTNTGKNKSNAVLIKSKPDMRGAPTVIPITSSQKPQTRPTQKVIERMDQLGKAKSIETPPTSRPTDRIPTVDRENQSAGRMPEERKVDGAIDNGNRGVTQTVQTKKGGNPCILPPEKGSSGGVAKKMWYFDVSALSCVQFTYFGSDGNDNRFASTEDCMSVCGIGKPTRKSCQLPLSHGDGPYKIARYYFDPSAGRCQPFFYSGQAGNDNRFYKKHKCERLCLGKKPKKKEQTRAPETATRTTIPPIPVTPPPRMTPPPSVEQTPPPRVTPPPPVDQPAPPPRVTPPPPVEQPTRSTTRTVQNLVKQPTTKQASPTARPLDRQPPITVEGAEGTSPDSEARPHPTLVFVPKEFEYTRTTPPTVIPDVDDLFSNLMNVKVSPSVTNGITGSPTIVEKSHVGPIPDQTNPSGNFKGFPPEMKMTFEKVPSSNADQTVVDSSSATVPQPPRTPFPKPGNTVPPIPPRPVQQWNTQSVPLPSVQGNPRPTEQPGDQIQNWNVISQQVPPSMNSFNGQAPIQTVSNNQAPSSSHGQGPLPNNSQGQVPHPINANNPDVHYGNNNWRPPPQTNSHGQNWNGASQLPSILPTLPSSNQGQPCHSNSAPTTVVTHPSQPSHGNYPIPDQQNQTPPSHSVQLQPYPPMYPNNQNLISPAPSPYSNSQPVPSEYSQGQSNPTFSSQPTAPRQPVQPFIVPSMASNQQNLSPIGAAPSDIINTTPAPIVLPTAPKEGNSMLQPTVQPTPFIFKPSPAATQTSNVISPMSSSQETVRVSPMSQLAPIAPFVEPSDLVVNQLPTDTFLLNLTRSWPTQPVQLPATANGSPTTTTTTTVATPQLVNSAPTPAPMVPPTYVPAAPPPSTQSPFEFQIEILSSQESNSTIQVDPTSPCLRPFSHDPVIMCEGNDVICPANTFCQIGQGQSMCCPLLDGSSCSQPVSHGVGPSSIPRWYFDVGSSQCKPFRFKGFQGNQNNFASFSDCLRLCPSSNPCSLGEPVEAELAGESCSMEVRCPSDAMCHTLPQGGGVCCPSSVATPTQAPPSVKPPKAPPMSSLVTTQTPKLESPCTQSLNEGHGDESHHRWAFESSTGSCISFVYLGEGGNMNNFLSRSDCLAVCAPPKKVSQRCLAPVHSGDGDSFLSRYFYSSEYRQCLHFIYSGQGGNSNNFPSQQTCLEECVANGISFSSLGTTPPTFTFSFLPTATVCPQGEVLKDASGQAVMCSGQANYRCPSGHVCKTTGTAAFCCPAPESFCLQPRPAISACPFGGNPVNTIRFTYDPSSDRCVRFSFASCSQPSLNVFSTMPRCERICCNQGYNLVYKRKRRLLLSDSPINDE